MEKKQFFGFFFNFSDSLDSFHCDCNVCGRHLFYSFLCELFRFVQFWKYPNQLLLLSSISRYKTVSILFMPHWLSHIQYIFLLSCYIYIYTHMYVAICVVALASTLAYTNLSHNKRYYYCTFVILAQTERQSLLILYLFLKKEMKKQFLCIFHTHLSQCELWYTFCRCIKWNDLFYFTQFHNYEPMFMCMSFLTEFITNRVSHHFGFYFLFYFSFSFVSRFELQF